MSSEVLNSHWFSMGVDFKHFIINRGKKYLWFPDLTTKRNLSFAFLFLGPLMVMDTASPSHSLQNFKERGNDVIYENILTNAELQGA